jgi:hypothetical protein
MKYAAMEALIPGSSPDDPHPMKCFPQVGFLKPLVEKPNIVVYDFDFRLPPLPERYDY